MTDKIWYPPVQEGFGPWIMHTGVKQPLADDVLCNVLLDWEIKYREVLIDEKPANYWNWECEGADRIVMYCVKL